ncbi:ABC transporter substrate-binding protein [Enterovirga sp. CN4-39]|uniref:ABC transporter substrate-binding protein n=1 Tax=Enterovirga sp. CN4-39 TaxID=3400910 RepID=UPI003C00B56A
MKRLVAAAVMLAATLTGAAAQAPKTKMTIGTGVDPSLANFYVAKVGGFFDKHGLDVQLNTGPSGSAMVPFLVQNQIQAALAAEQAGLVSHPIDNNIVVISQAMMSGRYFGIVARNIDNLDALKGKKVGVPVGSAGDVFWRALVAKLNLNPKDYTIVPVDPPEMVAALERGNIDAASAWEPWVTRTVQTVANTKMIRDNEGIISTRNFVYLNRGWADQNPDAAIRFMRALAEATDFINSNPDEAAKQTASFLKMEPDFTKTLMAKVQFSVGLEQPAIDYLKTVETQLREAGRLKGTIDWNRFIYPDLAMKVVPERVKLGPKS